MGVFLQFIPAFARALLWSGGWYWRLPLVIPAAASYFRDEKFVFSALGAAGMTGISHWAFLFASALTAALLYAFRTAVLEIPRLKVANQGRLSDGETCRYRVCVENLSHFKDAVSLEARLINITPWPQSEGVGGPVNLPLILPTKQKMDSFLAAGSSSPIDRWRLSSLERKYVEILQYSDTPTRHIEIAHENGKLDIYSLDHTFHYEVVGFGPPLQFSFRVWETEQGLAIWMITDALEALVVEQFSRGDLLSRKTEE